MKDIQHVNQTLINNARSVHQMLEFVTKKEKKEEKPISKSLVFPSIRKYQKQNQEDEGLRKTIQKPLLQSSKILFTQPDEIISLKKMPEIKQSKLQLNSKSKLKKAQLINTFSKEKQEFNSGTQSKVIGYLDPHKILEFVKKTKFLTQKSTPQEIYNYFKQIAPQITHPLIKKFNNCLYFGQSKTQNQYQGFLYFYSKKLYYGKFFNEQRDGFGVEINLQSNTIYKGNFSEGNKKGVFQVRRKKETYEGELRKGKYSGKGKLITPFTIYQGQFKQGARHGYGEQLILKTGLKLCGQFEMNKFINSKSSISKKKARKYVKNHKYSFQDESISLESEGNRTVKKLFKYEDPFVELQKKPQEDQSLPSHFKKYYRYKF